MVWLRYVDDVFSIWPAGNDFDSFFSKLNDLHPCIKFKVEWEENGQIPFLDVLVQRTSLGFRFSVYRKPTNSNSYIHYYSFHDKRVKKSVILGLFLRAYRICSPETLDDEILNIQRIFTELRYPEWFIHEAHMAARKTFFTKHRDKREVPKKCLVLPFNEGLTSFKDICRREDVGVAFTYPNTISKTLIRNNHFTGISLILIIGSWNYASTLLPIRREPVNICADEIRISTAYQCFKSLG